MTAKLVKARPKAVEYLPEWAKCCAEVIDFLGRIGEMTLDISRTKPQSRRNVCRFCEAEWPTGIMKAPDIADNHYVPLELVDLDETGIPNGNYVAGPTA